jgi:hypothetical protein
MSPFKQWTVQATDVMLVAMAQGAAWMIICNHARRIPGCFIEITSKLNIDSLSIHFGSAKKNTIEQCLDPIYSIYTIWLFNIAMENHHF